MSDELFKDVIDNAEKGIVGTTKEVTEGQRSEAWFEARRGKWTGSKLKDLMAKGRGNNIWGEKAKHYLFSKFMERLRGTSDTPIPSTWAMRRGTELEPYAIAAFEKMYPKYEIVECDFIEFPDYPTAGASPDGIVIDKKTRDVIGAFETKSRGDDGTYSHAFDRVGEKHPEFWQLQGEMLATNTGNCFYCHYTDLHEPPFDLQVQLVSRSPDHIVRLLERINEADAVVNHALEIVGNIEIMRPHELTEKITEARNFIYSR